VVNTLEKPSLPRRQLAANLPIFQKPYDRKPLGGKIACMQVMAKKLEQLLRQEKLNPEVSNLITTEISIIY
jgi:hypothetical protein